ncbi:AmmeMemoRadiSam system protein A [Candidatus Pacearchaeota archaeon]|nr:AmmeMemoRadiSam system protein A [Candidatus Pacearchaeota archaeon]MBD3283683.1 AmmeMemoRadiSam system protein A [Candidatus Pacearchaeota archaeon]
MKELLVLAREAINCYLNGKEIKVDDDLKNKYSEKRACFVTLTERGDLRGCIGSLQAHQPLWQDVIDNAVNAGFNDPRFPELEKEELEYIKIEISVLSKPEKLDYKDSEDLLEKIDNKMGIILKKQSLSSTFLPQVWEQIPDKELFLEELALKAGLFRDDWKTSEILFYRVDKVKE